MVVRGRILQFVWLDSGPDYSLLYETPTKDKALDELRQEVLGYTKQFQDALQENMLRAQHHMHNNNPKRTNDKSLTLVDTTGTQTLANTTSL